MVIRNTAKAIIMQNEKILLNRYSDFEGAIYYELPGGGQRQFETLEDAVIRECMEETGYHIKILRFAALAEEIYNDEILRQKYTDYVHRIHYIFIVELVDGIRHEILEKDLMQEASEWIPINQLSRIDLRPITLKDNFAKIIQGESSLYLGCNYVD